MIDWVSQALVWAGFDGRLSWLLVVFVVGVCAKMGATKTKQATTGRKR